MTRLRVPALDEAAGPPRGRPDSHGRWGAIRTRSPLSTHGSVTARVWRSASPPASPCAAITIRRFGGRAFTIAELVAAGAVSSVVVDEARRVLQAGGNVLIAGRHGLREDDVAQRADGAPAGGGPSGVDRRHARAAIAPGELRSVRGARG